MTPEQITEADLNLPWYVCEGTVGDQRRNVYLIKSSDRNAFPTWMFETNGTDEAKAAAEAMCRVMKAWPDIRFFLQGIARNYDDGSHTYLVDDAKHFLEITK